MTTINIALTGICSGGNHLTFSVTGAREMTVLSDLASLSEPISDEDAQAFLRVITRMARAGRTLAQARTLLQAGVEVTV
jgi:hypothetical protein